MGELLKMNSSFDRNLTLWGQNSLKMASVSSFSVVFDLSELDIFPTPSSNIGKLAKSETSRNDPSHRSLLDDGVVHKGEKIQICFSIFSNLVILIPLALLACYVIYSIMHLLVLFWLLVVPMSSDWFY